MSQKRTRLAVGHRAGNSIAVLQISRVTTTIG